MDCRAALAMTGESIIVNRTHAELDLTNQASVRAFFEAKKLDQVYLAAAKVGGVHCWGVILESETVDKCTQQLVLNFPLSLVLNLKLHGGSQRSAGAAAHWLGDRSVRNGRTSRMRVQEMADNTKISPLSDASALITSIAAAIRPNVGAVTVNSNGQRVYTDDQKILSL